MDLKPQNATTAELRNNFCRLKTEKKLQKLFERKTYPMLITLKVEIPILLGIQGHELLAYPAHYLLVPISIFTPHEVTGGEVDVQ